MSTTCGKGRTINLITIPNLIKSGVMFHCDDDCKMCIDTNITDIITGCVVGLGRHTVVLDDTYWKKCKK